MLFKASEWKQVISLCDALSSPKQAVNINVSQHFYAQESYRGGIADHLINLAWNWYS